MQTTYNVTNFLVAILKQTETRGVNFNVILLNPIYLHIVFQHMINVNIIEIFYVLFVLSLKSRLYFILRAYHNPK